MERYSRQIILEDFGEAGQERLAQATVCILGVGGLGCPAATYLTAAGVGHIKLIDAQSPEESNLNRQILHWPEDIDQRSKAESAAWKLARFNPEIELIAETRKVNEENIATVVGKADVVLDCSDNFTIRMILNDYCLQKGIPFVHGAVEGWHGQVTTVIPEVTPCLRCLFPHQPPQKELFPIIGAAAGIFGSLEAAEAIKVLTGVGCPLASQLLIGDLQYNQWDVIEINRREDCPACSKTFK